jgi:ribosomal protein L11 methylase PrmA
MQATRQRMPNSTRSSVSTGYHIGFQDNPSHRDRYLQMASKLFEFIRPLRGPGRVLDIGCSAGFFLYVAHQNGWKTLGLEFSGGEPG